MPICLGEEQQYGNQEEGMSSYHMYFLDLVSELLSTKYASSNMDYVVYCLHCHMILTNFIHKSLLRTSHLSHDNRYMQIAYVEKHGLGR